MFPFNFLFNPKAKNKSLQFRVSTHVASDPRVSISNFLFFPYETMSHCTQN